MTSNGTEGPIRSDSAPLIASNDVSALAKHVEKAAKFVSYQWPGVIEAGDAEQEIYLRLLESPGSVEKIHEMDHPAQYRAIVGIGNQIASQKRTSDAYHKGAYRYAVAEVKGLLKAGALKGLELDPDVQTYDSEGGKPTGGESNPPVDTAILDLRNALELLRDRNPLQADAIVTRFLFDEDPEKSVLHRGVESLTNEMNRVRRTEYVTRDDGVGTRHPIRRESARYLSKSHWDYDGPVMPAHLRDNAREKEVWE